MLENVGSILTDQCGLDKTRLVLVGVSGGPDSLCLLSVLHEAGFRVAVAHFNHGLRSEAGSEAAAVAQIAEGLGLTAVIESGDAGEHARQQRISIEEASRILRYGFLFRQARRLGAQAIAVGHTADDQVETVLMHLIRGSGLAGLKGMTYRTILPSFDPAIPIVRPLLDSWRQDTVEYCAARGLSPHYDPSNESMDFLRNRLRHRLIPDLESYNPRFRAAVWRTAQALAADHAVLAELVQSAWKECALKTTEHFVQLNAAALASRPAGLQRHIIRRAVEHLRPGQETSHAVLMRAASFLADAGRARAELVGGLHLTREAGAIYVTSSDAGLPSDRWPQLPDGTDSVPIPLPAEIELAGGWRFSAEPEGNIGTHEADRFQAWLDGGALPHALELRVRRRGDVFEPAGLRGHSQKLSDFFTNAKLPKRARDRWPLLCSGDRIIWVPGYRLAEPFKPARAAARVVHFALMRPPEEFES